MRLPRFMPLAAACASLVLPAVAGSASAQSVQEINSGKVPVQALTVKGKAALAKSHLAKSARVTSSFAARTHRHDALLDANGNETAAAAPARATLHGATLSGMNSSYASLVAKHAAANGLPVALVHRVIMRESKYNPRAISKGNYGMMQIRLGTARALGYSGGAQGLLDADTNMTYAVRYLAGAYHVAGGNHDRAVALYARGYYYDAKRKGLNAYSLANAQTRPAAAPQVADAQPTPEAAPLSSMRHEATALPSAAETRDALADRLSLH